jgi:hypothetical protein
MKPKLWLCCVGIVAVLTACPTLRPLDATNANNMRTFAPNAVGSATQFLRGAPVDVSGSVLYFQQSAQNNPRLDSMFAKAPINLATAFSRPQLQKTLPSQASSKLKELTQSAGVKVQEQGTNCGSANPTDTDGDGIPGIFNYTFNCSAAFYDNYAVLLTGSVYIKDLNDNDSSSGYDVRVTDLVFAYVDNASNYGFAYKMNYDVKVRASATSGKYTVTQNFNFVAVEINNGVSRRYEYYFNGTLEYTPAGNLTANARFAKGALKFNTKFGMKVKDGNEDYTSDLQFNSNGLQVDFNACGKDKMVDGGNVQFTDGKNSLTWTVTGCGAGTWNYQ